MYSVHAQLQVFSIHTITHEISSKTSLQASAHHNMNLDFAVGNEERATESERLRRRVEARSERLADGSDKVAIPFFSVERNAALRLYVNKLVWCFSACSAQIRKRLWSAIYKVRQIKHVIFRVYQVIRVRAPYTSTCTSTCSYICLTADCENVNNVLQK